MKNKFFLIVFYLFLPLFLFAQKDADWRYLFDKFDQGEVVYKKGAKDNADFNYFLITGKMVFLSKDGVVMEFTNPSIVSHVNIKGRVFEQIKNDIFYEQIKINDNCDLYVHWLTKVVSKGREGAYGKETKESGMFGVHYLSKFSSNIGYYDLDVKGQYDISSNNGYFLKIDGKFKKFSSTDSLAKLFKGHEKEIKEYFKTQRVDFKDVEDVKKAVNYCSQFMK